MYDPLPVLGSYAEYVTVDWDDYYTVMLVFVVLIAY